MAERDEQAPRDNTAGANAAQYTWKYGDYLKIDCWTAGGQVGNGATTTQSFDALGRVISSTDARGRAEGRPWEQHVFPVLGTTPAHCLGARWNVRNGGRAQIRLRKRSRACHHHVLQWPGTLLTQ